MNIGVKHNNENIFTRAIIAGVLNTLNNEISYTQYHCDGTSEDIEVPWYYNMSGDERFMQDFFTYYSHCLNSNIPKPITGNFESIPMGIITYSGSVIAQDALTNRFVRGRFYKEIDGKLESFSSYLMSIPLSLKFECDIVVDNYTNALRIEELIRETFYKTKTIYVFYKGLRVGAQIGFPESVSVQKSMAYSFESERNAVKLNFELEVETYQPCFDKTSERKIGSNIKEFIVGVNLGTEEKNKESLFFTSPSKSLQIVYKNMPYLIEWNYKNENANIPKVDLYYVVGNDEILISKNVVNHMSYMWLVPDISPFKYNIMFDNESNYIIEEPTIVIKLKPDGILSSNSFVILEEHTGMFNGLKTANLIIEYISKDGVTKYTKSGDVILNIEDGKAHSITVPTPIKLDIGDSISKTEVYLKLYNSINKEVCATSKKIEII
ncbi:MAG: hypothetical protein ACRDD8_10975 [Bacteroidales bacterium]